MILAVLLPITLVLWAAWTGFLVSMIGDRSLGRPPYAGEAFFVWTTAVVPPMVCWLVEYLWRTA